MSCIQASALRGSQIGLLHATQNRSAFCSSYKPTLRSRRNLLCRAEEKAPDAVAEAGTAFCIFKITRACHRQVLVKY